MKNTCDHRANRGTRWSAALTNVTYKPSSPIKIAPFRFVFLKSGKNRGRASAAVAVKDLRPLRGARARPSLTAILVPAKTSAMGAYPLPVFNKTRITKKEPKLCSCLTEAIHFGND